MRTTKHTEEPTFIVPAAVVDEVNAYLTRQNIGAVFNQPLVIGAADELVKDSEPLITHYGTSWRMTPVDKGIVQRFIQSRSGETIEKPFKAALVDRGAKRETESHPYRVVLLIRNGADKDAIVARMALRWPDSAGRFFLRGLSASGAAPETHWAEVVNADDRAIPLVKWVVDNRRFTEVLVSTRNGNGFGKWKTTFDKPLYQGVIATRTAGRVWLRNDWTLAEVLKMLGLNLIQ